MATWFVCPECRRTYGDPLYRGADGCYVRVGKTVYQGSQLCADCWCTYWHLSHFDSADRLLMLAYLIQLGWKQARIARVMGVHRCTIARWRQYLGKKNLRFSDFDVAF